MQLTDEDVEMGNGTTVTVACKDCLERKRAILYCSERCALERVGEHRKLAHDGATGSDQQSIVSLGQAVHDTLESENPNLKMVQLS